MVPLGNDRWQASFVPDRLGLWRFRVEGWHARYATWRSATQLKIAADQDVAVDLLAGAQLIDEALASTRLGSTRTGTARGGTRRVRSRRRREVHRAHRRPRGHGDDGRPPAARTGRDVARLPRARRSGAGPVQRLVRVLPTTGARCCDAIDRLDHIAELGFDVVYLPPIHPIGETLPQGPQQHTRGRRRRRRQPVGDRRRPRAATPRSTRRSARSPTFARWRRACRERGMDLALDLAFQCAPDHPWVQPSIRSGSSTAPTARSSTPRTRRRSTRTSTRSTSTSDDWAALWQALLEVVEFWIDAGVTRLPRRQPAHQAVPVLGVADRSRSWRATPK